MTTKKKTRKKKATKTKAAPPAAPREAGPAPFPRTVFVSTAETEAQARKDLYRQTGAVRERADRGAAGSWAFYLTLLLALLVAPAAAGCAALSDATEQGARVACDLDPSGKACELGAAIAATAKTLEVLREHHKHDGGAELAPVASPAETAPGS